MPEEFVQFLNHTNRIVVDYKKYLTLLSHIVLFLVMVTVLLRPLPLYAGALTSFTGKVKAVFAAKKDDDEQTLVTSQTMPVFKPTIVDGTTTDGAGSMPDKDQDSLSAVSGPLRVSTEDVDFPTSDTVSVYEVKSGDTLEEVAKLFSVSVNTIIWANTLTSKTISKGDTLIILPITGIKHLVKKGDTIGSIAKKYKADAQDIATYNGHSVEATLLFGDTIIVPDGEIEIVPSSKPKAPKTKKSKILNFYTHTTPSGFLLRPVMGARKTQGLHGHNGIDLGAPQGTPVLASAGGRVIVAKNSGYNGGYGSMIIISHNNGVQTVYGHLHAVYVVQGQTVAQGETIGEVGNTGRSTGSHLHFEVRGAKNPF